MMPNKLNVKDNKLCSSKIQLNNVWKVQKYQFTSLFIRVHIIIYFDDAVESFQNDQSCLICVYYIRTKQLWMNNESKKRTNGLEKFSNFR